VFFIRRIICLISVGSVGWKAAENAGLEGTNFWKSTVESPSFVARFV